MSKRNKKHIIAILFKWLCAIIMLIIVALIAIIYIGAITNYVTDIVAKQISASSDLEISVGEINIDFPLKVEISNTLIIDKSVNDTLLATKRLSTSIKPLDLFTLSINATEIVADTTAFNLFSEDNSLTLKLKTTLLELPTLLVNLNDGVIEANKVTLNDGNVTITINKAATETKQDTTNTYWSVAVNDIDLQRFNLNMQMLPTIDNLAVTIGNGNINNFNLNTETQILSITSFIADDFIANYYTPTDECLATYTEPISVTAEPTNSAEWRISIALASINNGSALYTKRNYIPAKGLDPSYIHVNNLELKITDFLNYGNNISLPIKSLEATERSGLVIREADGDFSIDSDGMHFTNFNIHTPESDINLNAQIGNSAFDPTATTDNTLTLSLKALLSTNDIHISLPSYHEITDIIPTEKPIMANLNITGDINNITLNNIELYQQELYTCNITGTLNNVMLDNQLQAQVQFAGDFININFLEDKLLALEQRDMINIPKFTINGKSNVTLSQIDAVVNLTTLNGAINANTNINLDSETYSANLAINSLAVNQIIPSIAIDSISTIATISGKQFDIFNPNSTLTSEILIPKVSYDSIAFDSINTKINIADGIAHITSSSINDFCNFNLDLISTILDNNYEYTLNSRIDALDINKLKLTENRFSTALTIASAGKVDINNNIYDINLSLDSLALTTGNNTLYSHDISTYLYSDSTVTKSTIESYDMLFSFNSNSSLDNLTNSLIASYEATMRHISEGDFKVDSIHEYLPELALTIDIGKRSIVERYMETEGIRFKNIDFDLYNDTTFALIGTIADLYLNGILIDSTSIKSNKGDNALFYSLDLFQKSGEISTQGSTHLNGEITANKVISILSKREHSNDYKLYLGATTTFADSTITVSFFPENPTIGGNLWALNESNYITYNYTRDNRNKAIRADLQLSEGSSLLSFRTFIDKEDINNINLSIKGIELGEWVNLSPFSPPITGILNTQANLTTRNNSVWGSADANITQFHYNNSKIGSIATELALELDPISKITNSHVSLSVNDKEVITADGHINDTISGYPASMKLAIETLPLNILNPLISTEHASISGYLNGNINIAGELNNPSINGSITGDSVNIGLPLFGSYLTLPNTDIDIKNSIVTFKNFNIAGTNNNTLALNGDIRLNSLTSPYINLSLSGNDIEIINSKQSKNSILFGKGSITLASTIKGTPNRLDINANLSLLSGSDITYVMQSDVSTLTQSTNSEDIVTFTELQKPKSLRNDSVINELPFGANINATLNINSGSAFNVYLTPNGYNRLYVTGSGKLDYTQNLIGDSNLIGRYTLQSGYIKYKPPLISMVNFNFTEGSYLSWSGDLMNPSLNIKGTESKKSNVTISGEDSRLIEFIIGLNVSNKLSNLDIALDLSTQDNVTIANQLLAMSAEERATQAMNLILYGSYTAAETSSSGSSLYTSPVYSFLEGQVNQWAAENIKAVDLSIGLNNYDQVVDGESKQATDYSYEISKSLLNNRFKITIGGSYNTSTTDEEEIALNLISNISFDYQLKENGNSYLKLFRQNGYESVLEGEVSSMGIGYLYKRKINSLKQLFRIRKQNRRNVENKTTENQIEE